MRQFFSDLRNDLLLSGAISLLLGLVLIFFPDTTSFLICYLCAGVMILFGLFQLLAFCSPTAPSQTIRFTWPAASCCWYWVSILPSGPASSSRCFPWCWGCSWWWRA